MPTGNRESRREASDGETDDGIDQALHELRDGLTVIHAYAQLLQRRLHPRQRIESAAMLERLAIIERTSMAMESRLRRLDRHNAGDF